MTISLSVHPSTVVGVSVVYQKAWVNHQLLLAFALTADSLLSFVDLIVTLLSLRLRRGADSQFTHAHHDCL